MWLDRVLSSGPLTYESGALPTALRRPAGRYSAKAKETPHLVAFLLLLKLMISISAVDLLSDSTGNDMVMMTIKNFDFLDNEIEEYEVNLKILFIIENQPSNFHTHSVKEY